MAGEAQTWTISQLAREFGVTPRALRFYEDKGLLSPRREGAARAYSARDRARLRLIVQGKRVGFPLAEIRGLLDLYDLGDGQRAQMAAARDKFNDRRTALIAQRADLEAAITALDEAIIFVERRLAETAPPGSAETARAFETIAKRYLEDVG